MRRLLTHPAYPLAFQIFLTLLLIVSITFLFLGPPSDEYNPGSYLIWYLWWAALPFTFLVLGRMWCALCPVGLLSDAVQKILPRGIAWPFRWHRYEMVFLTASLLAVHFGNLWFNFEENLLPGTLFILLMLLLSLAVASVFRQRVWCRVFCPVGALGGLMARLAPVRIREDREICGVQCPGAVCGEGSGKAKGCPQSEEPSKGIDPQFCTLCGECLKACPQDAPVVQWRPPGDISRSAAPSLPMAAAILILLGVALDMTVKHLNDWPITFWRLSSALGLPPAAWLEMILHGLIVISPALVMSALGAVTKGAASFTERLDKVSWPLLPLGCLTIAALSLRPLLIAGPTNLKGILLSAGHTRFRWLGAVRHLDGWPITLLQWALVGTGLILAWKILLKSERPLALVPTTLLAALILWLFSQPMVN